MAELYWDNGVVQLWKGDARDLSFLPDASADCVMSSPPYWGPRDYKLEPSVWGGEPGCDHKWAQRAVEREMRKGINLATSATSTRGGAKKIAAVGWQRFTESSCLRCGAWRGLLGLEPTPDLYVEHLVEIFREVRRVLKPWGTVWLNMGDSYAAGGNGSRDPERWPKQSRNAAGFRSTLAKDRAAGLKPKDLVGTPWRVALALQADGWWLRADIIWSKPNPMPESVSDRPTVSHEHVFLLAKAKRYYYDAGAVRQQGSSGPSDLRKMAEGKERIGGRYKYSTDGLMKASATTNIGRKRAVGSPSRNRRTVWEIATEPYPGPHYATFPPALVEPCVLAGTSERGNCARCGRPWKRVVEKTVHARRGKTPGEKYLAEPTLDQPGHEAEVEAITVGWRPPCSCDAATVPAVVLDPFAGTSTTGVVAQRLGRRAVMVDLSAEYLELSRRRLERVSLPLGVAAP